MQIWDGHRQGDCPCPSLGNESLHWQGSFLQIQNKEIKENVITYRKVSADGVGPVLPDWSLCPTLVGSLGPSTALSQARALQSASMGPATAAGSALSVLLFFYYSYKAF